MKQTRGPRREPVPAPAFGWSPEVWGRAVSFSRTSVYSLLNTDLAPQNIKIGGSRKIIETPEDWYKRVADLQNKVAES